MKNNQIRWQCRRGMLELDLILLKFFDGCFAELKEADKQLFIELLQETDQTLYQWLIKKTESVAIRFEELIQKIRVYTWKP